MTGWRLGWLVARRDLAARATQLNEFVVSHAPSFTQRAGETALLWGENALAEMLVRLKENRDFCLAALAKMPGVTVPKPDGAFYLFPKIAGAADSFDFCKRLLLETHVGLAPGVAFGAGGEGSVRICYAADRPILEEAMARLSLFLVSARLPLAPPLRCSLLPRRVVFVAINVPAQPILLVIHLRLLVVRQIAAVLPAIVAGLLIQAASLFSRFAVSCGVSEPLATPFAMRSCWFSLRCVNFPVLRPRDGAHHHPRYCQCQKQALHSRSPMPVNALRAADSRECRLKSDHTKFNR